MPSETPNFLAFQHKDFSAAQLKLIRRSVARACTDAEFDEFIAVASQSGLDPLRRQLAPLILNAEDQDRRRLVPWATIDGLRVIAARQGDYRPMETAPVIERDERSVSEERNPLGIMRAEVCAWKLSEGVWHPVAGEAWWDEFAPLREEKAPNEQGRLAPTGKLVLEPSWGRMGRVMIAKCAEAQALRRGWPDVLSGLYSEEELHAVKRADQTASDRLRSANEEADRLRTSAANALWLTFDPNVGLVSVPRGEVAARIGAFYRDAASASDIEGFQKRNSQSLQIFWDWAPAEALELKALAEDNCAAPAPRRRRRSRSKPNNADRQSGNASKRRS